MYTKIVQSKPNKAKSVGLNPITYFEAALLFEAARKAFSFIHYDPIDGESDGKITMVDFAYFIRADMWEAFKLIKEDRD